MFLTSLKRRFYAPHPNVAPGSMGRAAIKTGFRALFGGVGGGSL